MTKDQPVKAPPQKAEPEPAAKKEPKRGDPWQEPCPVCGLLGCRRHA